VKVVKVEIINKRETEKADGGGGGENLQAQVACS